MKHFKCIPFAPFLLLFLLAILSTTSTFSQEISEREFNHRQLDNNKLGNLKTLPAYDYSIKRGEGTTLWQRIKNWFSNLINSILNGRGTGMVIRVIIYVLIIGAAIFSILRFINTNPSRLFNRSSNQTIPYTIAEENIHEIDFDTQIEVAIENKDFRLATRLYYLRALKILTDSNLINWQAGKTNSDYYYELKEGNLRSNFTSLGHMFEYAWYGGFRVDQPIMSKARELYKEIKSGTSSDLT
jgi:hypothetical protein